MVYERPAFPCDFFRDTQELLLLLRTLAACEQGKSASTSRGGIGASDRPSWAKLQALAYSVFETLQSLLSVPSFVAVTQELLQHQVRSPTNIPLYHAWVVLFCVQ